MCGGAGEANDATEEVQKICDSVSRKIILETLVLITTHPQFTWPVFPSLILMSLILSLTQMKPHAEAKTGKNYGVFTAKKYKTQVVAGTNFFIKVIQLQEICFHYHLNPQTEEVIVGLLSSQLSAE